MAKVSLDISLNPVLNAPALNAQLELLKKALGPIGKGIQPIDEQAWRKSMASATDAVDELNKKLDDTGGKSTIFERVFKASAVTAGLNTMIAGVNQLASGFTELDTATAQLMTLGDEAKAMAPALRESAIAMSKDLPFAAAELQTTMFDALASGVKGGEEGLKSFAKTAAQLATGGGSSIGDATKVLAGQLNAYGKSAEEAGKFSDIFFNTVNFGVTSIPELSNTLSNVIPTAASLGIELENVGASLAVMTSKGVPTAQSTTKLNQLLLELAKPGAQLKPILDAAGVSLESLNKEDLPVTLKKVAGALNEAGIASVQAFSSSEAAAAFNVLAGDLEGFQQTFEDVRDTTGSAAFAYDQMGDSIEVKTKQMMSAVNAFIIEGLDVMGSGFVGLINTAGQLAPVVSTVAGLGAIIPEGAAGKVVDYAKQIGTTLVRSIGLKTAATTGATAAQTGLNAAMAANPIGAVIVGVVALVAATKLLSDALHETAEEKLEDQKATSEVLQAQRDATKARYDAIAAQVRSGESYKRNVEAVKEAEAAAKAEGLTIDQRAEKERQAAAAKTALIEKTADLTATFPKAADAGKSFEENLAGIQAASLKAADDLIAVAGELNKLDQQLAQAKKIELNLETQVAAEALEDTLSDSIDGSIAGILEGVAAGDPVAIGEAFSAPFTAGIALIAPGVSDTINEFLFGTSTSRKRGERFIDGFKKDVFGAKTSEEIAAAQSKMIAEISLKSEELGLDPKEQAELIKGVKAFGDKRKAELEAIKSNDANLASTTQASIADAFAQATAAGKDVTSTIDKLSKAFGLSGEKVKSVAIDSELQKASDAGEITANTVTEIAKRFSASEADVKKAAFSTEMKAALAAGEVTAKQIDEIAGKYGVSSDEARKLVAEQQRQVAAAKETKEEVAKIGDAFNETKKAAQQASQQQKADLAALLQQRREARTKEEREQADADIKKIRQSGLQTTKQLKQIEADEKAAAALVGQGEAKKLKSLKDVQDQILQIERDAAQTRAQIAERSIQDETERAIAERQRAAAAELRTIDDEIERVRKDKEISAQARQALEVALTDKRNAIVERQEADRADFDVATYAKKTTETLAKKKALEDQATAEEVALRAARITNLEQMDVTAGDVSLARVKDLGELRLQELRQANRAEIDAIVEKNIAVVRAQEALDKALSEKSSTEAIDAAREALEKAKSAALDTDSVVLEVKKRQLKAETDLEDQNRKEKRAAEIAQITDLSIQKRDLAVFEAEKTLEEARKAAQGNREAELAAEREFQKAKRAIELDYLSETAPFFAAGLQAAQELQSSLAGVYDAGAAEQSAKEEEAHQKRLDQYQAEQDALKARLDAGLLLWEDYQQQIDELDQQRADAEAERAEKASEEEDKRRAAVADSFRKAADQQADAFIDSAANGETAFEKLAASAAFNFAAIGAAGENFKDQFFGIMLDIVTKSITAYLPQIYAASIGLLGPILGPVAATTAVAFVLTKASEARASIGAQDGVVPFTAAYSKAPGPRDTHAIMIEPGEALISRANTNRNIKLLQHINSGGDERAYFDKHYAAPIRAEVDAKIERLADAVRHVAKSVKNVRDRIVISARQTSTRISHHDIHISQELYAKLQRAAR